MKYLLLIYLLSISSFAGWEGFDFKYNRFIEIDKNELVRPGKKIFYRDDSLNIFEAEVISIYNRSSAVELWIYDLKKEEEVLFQMNKY